MLDLTSIEGFLASMTSFKADEIWFVMTNMALVLACLASFAIFAVAIIKEVFLRGRARVAAGVATDVHILHEPALGITMADGGEPEDEEVAADLDSKNGANASNNE